MIKPKTNENLLAGSISSLFDYVVIAIGKKSTEAVVEPQWRREFDDAVKIY